MAKPSGCLKLFFAVPLALIVFGVGLWFLSNVDRVVNHDTAEGVVVELTRGSDSDGDITYTPTYLYEVAGESYRYESQVSYGGMLIPEIGDVRTILYDPGNPVDAQVRNIFVLIWLPLILMAIPIAILILMAWSTVRRRRRMTEVPTQLSQTVQPPWADQATQPPWAGSSDDTSWDPPVEASRSTVEALFMGTEPSQMDAEGNIRYRVKARADIDGAQHRFVSDWLDEDPTLYYMQHGNKVEVRVDPDDPTSYEVVLPNVE